MKNFIFDFFISILYKKNRATTTKNEEMERKEYSKQQKEKRNKKEKKNEKENPNSDSEKKERERDINQTNKQTNIELRNNKFLYVK